MTDSGEIWLHEQQSTAPILEKSINSVQDMATYAIILQYPWQCIIWNCIKCLWKSKTSKSVWKVWSVKLTTSWSVMESWISQEQLDLNLCYTTIGMLCSTCFRMCWQIICLNNLNEMHVSDALFVNTGVTSALIQSLLYSPDSRNHMTMGESFSVSSWPSRFSIWQCVVSGTDAVFIFRLA